MAGRLRVVGWFCAVVLASVVALTPTAFADTTLAPIVVRGDTAGDVLSEDPIVPALRSPVTPDEGRGSVGRELDDRLPIQVFESAGAGGLTQVRGLGRSAEDVGVQALGIPLNGPQGGGFDFSTFPQYLWSTYEFQLSPSLSAFDPRAVSGTLSLTPWTATEVERLREDAARPGRARATGLYSDANLRQVSVGGTYRAGETLAALVAGWSDGSARGPSGALSLARGLGRGATLAFHLLATDQTVDVAGSKSFPTPLATQETVRVIPLLQLDLPLGEQALLKCTFFLDSSFLRNDDPTPGTGSSSRARTTQYGLENVLVTGSWKLGASYRHVGFDEAFITPAGPGFSAPAQDLLNLQAGPELRWAGWELDPTAQLLATQGVDPLPAGSLGLRRELDVSSQLALSPFARLSLSRRVASLVDRYFNGEFFLGNPALAPETDWTAQAGATFRERGEAPLWETSLQAYAQWRENAQVTQGVFPQPSTVVNQGEGRVLGLIHAAILRPEARWELDHSLTWVGSRLAATGAEFPYLPNLTEVLRAGWRSGSVRAALAARFSGSALADPSQGTRVAGYGYLDFSLGIQLLRGLELTARLDNVFDRQYELIRDFAAPGRTLTLGIFGIL